MSLHKQKSPKSTTSAKVTWLFCLKLISGIFSKVKSKKKLQKVIQVMQFIIITVILSVSLFHFFTYLLTCANEKVKKFLYNLLMLQASSSRAWSTRPAQNPELENCHKFL